MHHSSISSSGIYVAKSVALSVLPLQGNHCIATTLALLEDHLLGYKIYRILKRDFEDGDNAILEVKYKKTVYIIVNKI